MRAEFQIDTITVSQLGTDIVNGAEEEKASPNPLALDNLQRDLNTIIPQTPQILHTALTQFNTNFCKNYTDVLDQRIGIGHILLNTASTTEKQEVQTTNSFLDSPPQILIN